MSDFDEMLKRLRSSSGDDDGSDPTIEDVQACARLVLEQPYKFKALDVVQHKFPKWATQQSAEKLGIFLNYIEPIDMRTAGQSNPEFMFTVGASMYLDCEVMYPQNGSACIFLTDSRLIKPYKAERQDA